MDIRIKISTAHEIHSFVLEQLFGAPGKASLFIRANIEGMFL